MSGAPPSVTIGIPAHNGGQFFKWAADEDAFENTCLERCVDVLREDDSDVWTQSLIRSRAMRRTALQLPFYGGDKVFVAQLGRPAAHRRWRVISPRAASGEPSSSGLFRTGEPGAAARDSSPRPNREVIAHDRHRW